MIRWLCIIFFTIIMFMMPITGIADKGTLVELESEQREWLEYRCSLPDGGLILTGGMRLYGAGKETGSYVLCLNADRTVRQIYSRSTFINSVNPTSSRTSKMVLST